MKKKLRKTKELGYMQRLSEIGRQAPDGKLTHVYIAHDDGCEVFKGGECNCTPDISYETEGGEQV